MKKRSTITIYDGYNAIAEYHLNSILPKEVNSQGLDLSTSTQGQGTIERGGFMSMNVFTLKRMLLWSLFLFFIGCGKLKTEGANERIDVLISQLEEGEIQEDELPDCLFTNCRFGKIKDYTFSCSKCYKKTVYDMTLDGKSFKKEQIISSDVLYSRNYLLKLKRLSTVAAPYGLKVALDSTDFCPHCSKKESFKHYLIVQYPDGEPIVRILREPEDMEKLIAFLEGKRVWTGLDCRRKSLRKELALIKYFLGIGESEYPAFLDLSVEKKADKAADDYFEDVLPTRKRQGEK